MITQIHGPSSVGVAGVWSKGPFRTTCRLSWLGRRVCNCMRERGNYLRSTRTHRSKGDLPGLQHAFLANPRNVWSTAGPTAMSCLVLQTWSVRCGTVRAENTWGLEGKQAKSYTHRLHGPCVRHGPLAAAQHSTQNGTPRSPQLRKQPEP